jgi:hypothetical protein
MHKIFLSYAHEDLDAAYRLVQWASPGRETASFTETLGEEDPTCDERVVDSVSYLVDGEHQTKSALFGKLVPFASTNTDMRLSRAYVDLFCFDTRGVPQGLSANALPVVLWRAHEALEAFFEWEALPIDAQFDATGEPTNVPWSRFIVEVAPSFQTFADDLVEREKLID